MGEKGKRKKKWKRKIEGKEEKERGGTEQNKAERWNFMSEIEAIT